MQFFKANIDRFTGGILWLMLAITAFWPPLRPVLEWDVFGYYLYLPALFIYDDPGLFNFNWVEGILLDYNPTGTFYQGVKLDDGGFVMRYPIGPAVLNLPFFLLAEIIAPLFGFAADGFSNPYQAAWIAGSLFWSAVGLWVLGIFLRRYLSPAYVAASIAIIGFGTNYFQLAGISAALPHAFLFTLFAALLETTARWQEKPSVLNGMLSGLLLGLIAITRPNEVLVGIIPLLWGVAGISLFQERFRFFWQKRKALLWVIAGFIIGLLPQMVYWKWRTGQWLYWSYQDPAVGFDLLNPHTIPFLFSFRKGWFIYTPIAIVLLLALVKMLKTHKGYAIPVILFLIPHLYIVSSWTCWWYAGGSFSARSMVPVYALLALPLGWWLKDLSKIPRIWKISGVLSLILMCTLNLFQTWQFSRGILDGERMTQAYYLKIFGKTSVDDADRILLLPARPTESIEHIPEDFLGRIPDKVFEIHEGSEETLSAENPFSKTLEISHLELLQGNEYAWLRAEAEFECADKSAAPLLVVSYHYKFKGYKYRSSENLADSLNCPGWVNVSMDYMTPEARTEKDVLKVYLWYRGTEEAKYRKIRLKVYYPR